MERLSLAMAGRTTAEMVRSWRGRTICVALLVLGCQDRERLRVPSEAMYQPHATVLAWSTQQVLYLLGTQWGAFDAYFPVCSLSGTYQATDTSLSVVHVGWSHGLCEDLLLGTVRAKEDGSEALVSAMGRLVRWNVGSGAFRPIDVEGGRSVRYAVWGPDDQSLTFAGGKTKNPEGDDTLFRANIDGSGVQPVAVLSSTMIGGVPAWSPRGDRIAVPTINRTTAQGMLDIMDTLGNVHTTISEGREPSWSPTGEWIAYVTTQNGGSLCIVRRDGRDDQAVYEATAGVREGVPEHDSVPGVPSGPVWHPDGARIAFALQGASGSSLWVVDLLTRRLTRLPMPPPPVRNDRAFGWSTRK